MPTMKWFRKTCSTVAMMFVPPLPPTTPASWPSCSGNTGRSTAVSTGESGGETCPIEATRHAIPTLSMMSGVMEERGRLPGAMKFAGAGGSCPGVRFVAGTEKSSISLFSTMPVDGDSTLAPK